MSVISISIDICNSTKIKQDISVIGRLDQEYVRRLYEDFVLQAAVNEVDFYACMVDAGLSQDQIFVVKAIGDEVWTLYELGDIKPGTLAFNQVIQGLLSASEAIAARTRVMQADDLAGDFSAEVDSSRRLDRSEKSIRIVPKIYLDLIEDFIDFSKVRTDYFQLRMSELLQGQTEPDEQIMQDNPDIPGRFALGKLPDNLGTRYKTAFRTDPVGYEVDVFFRSAKAAVPGMTSIGERLFNALLQYDGSQMINDRRDNRQLFDLAGSDDGSSDSYIHLNRILSDLKGVEGDYTIHFLHKESAFKDRLRSWMDEPEIYRETLNLLVKRRDTIDVFHGHRFQE